MHSFSGEDFTNNSITVTIPPAISIGDQFYTLPIFFSVIDDDINEIVQSFALVAEIGPDVPVNCFVDGVGITDCSCFQTSNGETDCYGRRGATEIRITDNDSKLLFF